MRFVSRPSGTKAWTGFSGLLWDQILVTLDILVRFGVNYPCVADKNVRAPFFNARWLDEFLLWATANRSVYRFNVVRQTSTDICAT